MQKIYEYFGKIENQMYSTDNLIWSFFLLLYLQVVVFPLLLIENKWVDYKNNKDK